MEAKVYQALTEAGFTYSDRTMDFQKDFGYAIVTITQCGRWFVELEYAEPQAHIKPTADHYDCDGELTDDFNPCYETMKLSGKRLIEVWGN